MAADEQSSEVVEFTVRLVSAPDGSTHHRVINAGIQHLPEGEELADLGRAPSVDRRKNWLTLGKPLDRDYEFDAHHRRAT